MRVQGAERGAAFLEFAVAIPMLIMLVMGLVQLSIVLYSSISVKNCAVVAARYAAVETTATNTQVETFAKDTVASLVGSRTPTVTVTRNPVVNGTTYNGAVQVDIDYSVPLIVPARLMGSADGDFTVSGRSIMQ